MFELRRGPVSVQFGSKWVHQLCGGSVRGHHGSRFFDCVLELQSGVLFVDFGCQLLHQLRDGPVPKYRRLRVVHSLPRW